MSMPDPLLLLAFVFTHVLCDRQAEVACLPVHAQFSINDGSMAV